MLDFLEILSDVIGTMELKEGYNSLEEQEFFEWHHAEWDRIHSDASMSEEERSERGYELGELKVISQYPRRAEFVPTFIDSYKKRLAESRNYYDKRPLNWTHWTSSTVK